MPITRADLIILAFLSENASHGWEIDKKLVEIGADYWAEYSRPHLYYSLRKLAREGLVELVKKERDDLKKQFCLTNKGREFLSENPIVPQLFYNRTFFDFDLLLGFADRFSGGKAAFRDQLVKRQEALEEELSGIQVIWEKAEKSGEMPFGKLAVIKHRIKFLKSEIDFLKWLDKSTPHDWDSLKKLGED